MQSLQRLSNEALVTSVLALNSNEIATVASLLLHLIEIGRRRLYARLGYPSLFAYCVGALKYCDGTAGRRVIAARCVEKYPRLLELFSNQKVSLTTIVLVSKIITEENQALVIEAVCDKSKSEVERYVAGFMTGRNIREGVKLIPPSKPLVLSETSTPTAGPIPVKELPAAAPKAQTQAPIAQPDEQYVIKLKATQLAIKKLRRVQELRGRKEALGDLFEVLLDEYLNRHSPEARLARRERRKSISTVDFRANGAPLELRKTRHISSSIRDELHAKFESQCSYKAPDGTRCACRTGLQVDHIYPYGAGGGNEPSNLRLLCPAHNRLAAEEFYGKAKMAGFARAG